MLLAREHYFATLISRECVLVILIWIARLCRLVLVTSWRAKEAVKARFKEGRQRCLWRKHAVYRHYVSHTALVYRVQHKPGTGEDCLEFRDRDTLALDRKVASVLSNGKRGRNTRMHARSKARLGAPDIWQGGYLSVRAYFVCISSALRLRRSLNIVCGRYSARRCFSLGGTKAVRLLKTRYLAWASIVAAC